MGEKPTAVDEGTDEERKSKGYISGGGGNDRAEGAGTTAPDSGPDAGGDDPKSFFESRSNTAVTEEAREGFHYEKLPSDPAPPVHVDNPDVPYVPFEPKKP